MSDVRIETVNLNRGYRIGDKSIEVRHGIDLRVQRGERLFLCGPSARLSTH
jgi:putative ABC transport system ATP-binding protein/lipoprotein-releasing system ATP-binding protein